MAPLIFRTQIQNNHVFASLIRVYFILYQSLTPSGTSQRLSVLFSCRNTSGFLLGFSHRGQGKGLYSIVAQLVGCVAKGCILPASWQTLYRALCSRWESSGFPQQDRAANSENTDEPPHNNAVLSEDVKAQQMLTCNERFTISPLPLQWEGQLRAAKLSPDVFGIKEAQPTVSANHPTCWRKSLLDRLLHSYLNLS